MQLTALDKVKVGSTIKVGGESYQVKQNWTSDLVLTKGGQEFYFNSLIRKAGITPKGSDHQVFVEAAPAQTASLADQFRKQLQPQAFQAKAEDKQAKLTDSLKAQVSTPKPSLTDSLRAQVAVGNQSDATVRGNVVNGAADVKIGALNAKVDTVQAGAAKASLRATEAASAADRANAQVEEMAFAFNGFAYETTSRLDVLEEEVARVVEEANDCLDERDEIIEDLHERISALEDAEAKRALQERLNQALAQNKTTAKGPIQGGNSTMKNILGNFKNLFGKVEGQFALSLFGGVAVRKSPFSQEWVTYDATNGITDVQGNVLKFDVPAFRLPVAAKDVKKGNIVVAQNGNYGYVTEVADGFVKVIFPATASQGTVLPIRNPLLNKAFYTVVNVLDIAGGQTGGFNPLLLAALGGESNKSDLLPILLASGGLTGDKAGAIDPTMLLALGGDNGFDDILPLLLLQQGGFAKDGVNPLLFLALGDKGGKGKDLLPILLATGGLNGGADAGAINPMLLLALGGDNEGGDSFKDILMIQAISGGNLFGAPAAAPKTEEAVE